MSGFDPGEGWREVAGTEAVGKRRVFELDENGEIDRVWVREEPVSPLPTEPYTVIRMTPPDGYPPALYVHDGERLAMVSSNAWLDHVDARCAVEVLAEPRAGAVKRAEESARRLTVKDVLNRIRVKMRADGTIQGSALAIVAREMEADL